MAVKFERQHFNAIAKILRTELNEALAEYTVVEHASGTEGAILYAKAWERVGTIEDLAERFASYFELGNELFDRQKFFDAVRREDTDE